MAKKRSKRPRRHRAPRQTEHRVLFGFVEREKSDFEKKAKQVALRFLEAAERDPKRAIEGIGKVADATREAIRFVQQNPKQAKQIGSELGLGLLAGIARRQLQKRK